MGRYRPTGRPAGRPPKLTDAETRELVRDWPTTPPRDLAARYGVSVATVYSYRARVPPSETDDFPFTWFPPVEPTPKQWRCPCGNRSHSGPQCQRCKHQEAA